jgi:hypothetical protein
MWRLPFRKLKTGVIGLIAVIGFVSCGDAEVPEENQVKRERQNKNPDFYLEFEELMEFVADKESSYEILARVPDGEPVISISSLPEGAVFDGKTLSWKPPLSASVDVRGRGAALHRISVQLTSSADTGSMIKESGALLVWAK